MKRVIQTSNASTPIGPYSQAILVDEKTLYVSGVVGIDPKTGNLLSESIETETTQIMKNLKAILEAAGMDYSHVVKTTIFMTDLGNFARMNAIYGSCFTGDFPARETVQVVRLPKDASVEISVVAIK